MTAAASSVDHVPPPACRQCPALRCGPCGLMTGPQLRRLGDGAKKLRIQAGTAFGSGMQPDSLLYACSGVALLAKVLPDGRQQIVALQEAPELLGRPFAREADIRLRSVTEMEVCALPRAVFEAIAEANPGVQRVLYLRAIEQLDEARDMLLTLGRKSARERVATFIEQLRSRSAGPAGKGRPVDLRLTRMEIADFLGLTLETVSRQFAALKREGIIAFEDSRAVRICDAQRLRDATADR